MRDAAVEFHSQRFMHIFEYIHVVVLPPPFRCRGCCSSTARQQRWRGLRMRSSGLPRRVLRCTARAPTRRRSSCRHTCGRVRGATNAMRKLEMISGVERTSASGWSGSTSNCGHSAMGYSDEELRGALGSLLARIERGSTADTFTRSLALHARSSARWSARATRTAAAPIVRSRLGSN